MPTPCTADTDCIALSIDDSGVLSADVVLAPIATNGLQCIDGSGLYAAARPRYVTSLPSGAQDGDEVFFGGFSTNGEIWHMRYNGLSASPYKWEFVGGSSIYTAVDTSESRSSATYGPLATPVTITLPANLQGDWWIHHGCVINSAADGQAAMQTVKLGTAAAADAQGVRSTSTRDTQAARVIRPVGLAGGAVMALNYASPGGSGNAVFRYRWMELHPVRVVPV